MRRLALLLPVVAVAACVPEVVVDEPTPGSGRFVPDGKADGFSQSRAYEVLFTAPYCDVCSDQDKAFLVPRSPITARVVQLLDSAQERVDIAQFTFSVRAIEAAVLRARERGVEVRVAMDAKQEEGDTVARRLAEAGVKVRFVAGKPGQGDRPPGLQHAKFILVDGATLATGSNNWSSTGTSINEESTIVVRTEPADPLLMGFHCHFEAMWEGELAGAGACSTANVTFAPSSAPIDLLRRSIRGSARSVDVLMHHFLFDDLVKELAKAAERGVRVRVIVNAADRAEVTGSAWDRLQAAGGQLRFKRTNAEAFQLMHHKLAIVDDRVLVNGSGNWSGSAFFNNWENYVRYEEHRVVRPYVDLFRRLWSWSLTAGSLDGGKSPAEQHAAETSVFFGNLHAHYAAGLGADVWDDGKPQRLDEAGQPVPVPEAEAGADPARHAFRYARDTGRLDFMALTPHCVDVTPEDAVSLPGTPSEEFAKLEGIARELTGESGGAFVALPGMEWSTNNVGNHVNVLGSSEIAHTERGRFDLLYGDFLAGRAAAGDRPMLQLNHPRTFSTHGESDEPDGELKGNWDQVFGRSLLDVARESDRAQKFNDFGLDDFPPLSEVREAWITGAAMPDPAVVEETLANLEEAARPYARLMEVTVSRGTELGDEARRNPSIVPDEATGGTRRYTHVESDWEYYLLRGFRLAPTANGDNHYANWGAGHSTRTAVVARSLSEAGILDAVDERAVYASEAEHLAVRLYADARTPMGGETRTPEARLPLLVQASDPDHAGPIHVRVRGGRIGEPSARDLGERELSPGAWETFEVELPEPGVWFVYLELHEVDRDRMAWTAPIWVERL